MKYRPEVDALLFDLDGTLWDASQACALAWSEVCSKLGLKKTVTAKEIRTVSGLPFESCVNALFGEGSPADLRRLLEQAERDVIEKQGGVCYPEVQEGVRRLATSHKLFLVSNCQDWYLDVFLRQTGLRHCFVESLCHGSTQMPKVENIRSILWQHKLRKPVYLGDTHWDQEAAFLAGSRFVLAGYGFGTAGVSCPRVASFAEFVEVFTERPSHFDSSVRKLNSHELAHAQAFYHSVGYQVEISAENSFYGAFHEDVLVGLVRLVFENNVWVLRGMQIDPSFQLFGLGTKLIKLLEKDLEADCYCLPHRWLEAFYGQIGFQTVLDLDLVPRFLKQRQMENLKKYPQLILMKRPKT